MISAHKFLLPLAGCLALMPACGDGVGRDGGRDSNASDGNVVDIGASPDTGGTEDSGVAADSGQAGSDAGGSFRLEVVNGFGSGVYAAGSTVHVWSAASANRPPSRVRQLRCRPRACYCFRLSPPDSD